MDNQIKLENSVFKARNTMLDICDREWKFSYTKSDFYSRFPSSAGLIDVITPVLENEIEK